MGVGHYLLSGRGKVEKFIGAPRAISHELQGTAGRAWAHGKGATKPGESVDNEFFYLPGDPRDRRFLR